MLRRRHLATVAAASAGVGFGVPPASAQASRLPLPVHASDAQRAAIAAAPEPNAAAARARLPRSAEEWRSIVSAQQERAEPAARALIAASPARVEAVTLGGTNAFRITPQRIAPVHGNHLFVHVHGGAWVHGGGVTSTFEALVVSLALGIPAIAIDYRMPPDHPAPTPRDDILAAWRALVDSRPPRGMAFGGTSAGGNLALSALLGMKDRGVPLPGAIVIGTPAVDLAARPDTRVIMEGIDRHLVSWDGLPEAAAALYAGGVDRADPSLSPIRGDWSGFPPAYLVSGTRDLMLSDTVLAHRKLRRAGVTAELHVYEGHSHGDYVGPLTVPEVAEHMRELDAFLQRHLAA
jgi:acetyl esterase/lipase